MGTGPNRKKRTHKNDKHIKRKYRTRRRERDIDQVHVDLQNGHGPCDEDEDLPGGGRHYCITCARHFIGKSALLTHMKSKLHKRRMHFLKSPVYSQGEADRAAGQGSYFAGPGGVETMETMCEIEA